MRPTENVRSGSVDSIRVVQMRRLSGNPSRSRAPGSSSRKKSASLRSNDRSPFGTILTARPSESDRSGAIDDGVGSSGGGGEAARAVEDTGGAETADASSV